jgi:hypothetical protein
LLALKAELAGALKRSPDATAAMSSGSDTFTDELELEQRTIEMENETRKLADMQRELELFRVALRN